MCIKLCRDCAINNKIVQPTNAVAGVVPPLYRYLMVVCYCIITNKSEWYTVLGMGRICVYVIYYYGCFGTFIQILCDDDVSWLVSGTRLENFSSWSTSTQNIFLHTGNSKSQGSVIGDMWYKFFKNGCFLAIATMRCCQISLQLESVLFQKWIFLSFWN